MDTTVAILPANFNPAHIGYAEAVNLLLEQFDRVILAPSQNAPSTREVRTHLLPLMGESLTDLVVNEGTYRAPDKLMSPAASNRRRAMASGSLLAV